MDDKKIENLGTPCIKKEIQRNEDEQSYTIFLDSSQDIKQEYCHSSTEDDVIGIVKLEEGHITIKHEEYSEQQFKYISKVKYNEKSKSIQHSESGSVRKNHVCNSFSEAFIDKSKLLPLNTNRKNEKYYKCKYCNKWFPQNILIVSLERIHSSEKPYKCKYYDELFSHEQTLSIHEKNHTGEKRFKCKYCEKSFSMKHHLSAHERIHTGEKTLQMQIL